MARITRVRGRRLALVAIALAASTRLFAAEHHNIVLFIPELLSAASAEDRDTPTLTRLRDEGVNFLESHSHFPPLAAQSSQIDPDFMSDVLIHSAAAAQYSAVLLENVDVDREVAANLRSFKDASRPFVLICRMTANSARSADDALAAIESSLKTLELYEQTNIIVAAESGLAGIWKVSRTSMSVAISNPEDEDELGKLPPGFLAIDVAAVMQKLEPRVSLFDPDKENEPVDWIAGEHPLRGNGIIGMNATAPQVVIEARGGHDVLFLSPNLSKAQARDLADYLVRAILKHDYVSGVFVNEKRVGRIRGTLSQAHLGWSNSESTPLPDIVVNFASVSAGCRLPMTCAYAIADTPLEEGDDIRGAFSRADTWTFMAARGPDFRAGFIDPLPASNADVARTILHLIAPQQPSKSGGARVLTESLHGHEHEPLPKVRMRVIDSKPSAEGLVTEVLLHNVGDVQYFDAAGFPGWTLGIQYKAPPVGWRPWEWDWPHPRSLTITIGPD